MKKIWLMILTLFFASNLYANLITKEHWIAGKDLLNRFYAQDYLEVTYVDMETMYQSETFMTNTSSARRGIIYASHIPTYGSYSYSFDSMFTNYQTQYNYFHVYLFNDYTKFNLTTANNAFLLPLNAYMLANNYAPDGKDGNIWYNYVIDFNIYYEQTIEYDYIGFLFVGSRSSEEEIVAYKNFNFNIPEPFSLALMSLGFLMMKRKR